MGRILFSDNFEIYVFSRDHRPAHFHVYFPKKKDHKAFLKIELNETLDIIDLENISQRDVDRLAKFLTDDRIKLILEEWERFHEQ